MVSSADDLISPLRLNASELFTYPQAEDIVEENPPLFLFKQDASVNNYLIEVYDSDGFLVSSCETIHPYLRLPEPLKPGSYTWRLVIQGSTSKMIPFTLSEYAVPFTPPSAKAILMSIPRERPRHLFESSDISTILAEHSLDLSILKRNISSALSSPMPVPPSFHYNDSALKYRPYFIYFRKIMDRDLVSLALGWALLHSEEAGASAVSRLLLLCTFNPDGPCSIIGPWGDEIGLSFARCLPSIIDLLWDRLDEKQRSFCLKTLSRYAEQCAYRIKKESFLSNPGNSHVARLPAYLGEAAICLAHTGIIPNETLLQWLSLSLEIFSTVFPFYGCQDGGWAEGPFYAASYSKWFLPFFHLVERYGHVNFLVRPFYQRFPLFLAHFCPPNQDSYPFGDGYWNTPDSQEFPGFMAQNPYRHYTNNKLLELYTSLLPVPDHFEMHLLDIFMPSIPPPVHRLPIVFSPSQAFPLSGFLSLHTDLWNPSEDLCLIARGSRYGSVSHQHADQGSFSLKYGGVTLITPSGYYDTQYNSTHHRLWTRTTKAHNSLLINGIGQPDRCPSATARILYAHDGEGAIDATEAYPNLGVLRFIRSFSLKGNRLLVKDDVLLDKPGEITYCLHTPSPLAFQMDSISFCHQGISVQILPITGLLYNPLITDHYDTPMQLTSFPKQWHLYWKTDKKRIHHIEVSFIISPPDTSSVSIASKETVAYQTAEACSVSQDE